MKNVQFVKIKSEINGYGFGKGMAMTFNGIEDTIREWIKNGWDYCGYVPVSTRGTGEIETLSLIFTKEE